MPHFPTFRSRQVSFTPAPIYSRLPRDDEAYVMKAFQRHASHCPSCVDPFAVHMRGGTLCPKGHQRALDVAQYVYNQGGKAYSLVDHEGTQRVQIEIPVGCESVRSLLRAMERGLRIMRRAPSVSYDKTYYVSARPVSRPVAQREPSYIRKPRLETAEPPAWAVNGKRSYSLSSSTPTPSYARRGSLYDAEMQERRKYYKPTVYYRVSTQQAERPPVPPKDYYWR
ncbi:hypothetical protein MMC19_005480 [Ptychographa xylographoides]|nr:hypothetical protein [Ptychographa xylographoides]